VAAGHIIPAGGLLEYTTGTALYCAWPRTAQCPNQMTCARSPDTEPSCVKRIRTPKRRES